MRVARVLLRSGSARYVELRPRRRVRSWVLLTAVGLGFPAFVLFAFGKVLGL